MNMNRRINSGPALPVEQLDLDRDCPRVASDRSVFDFDSDLSEYDDIHWLDDSGHPSDFEVSSECFMDALSPLCLESTPIETNVVRYRETTTFHHHHIRRRSRRTLSDSEFDYSASSHSQILPLRRKGSASTASSFSSGSPIFHFPSTRSQSGSPRLAVAPPPTVTFASTFSTNRCSHINQCLISSKALSSGYHEWSVKIKRCGSGMQEIGMVTNCDLSKVLVDREGNVTIRGNSFFSARAVYGSHSRSSPPFYASFSAENKTRCFRELPADDMRHEWRVGDIITVCCDMDRQRVKFVKNGKSVRKSMSLEVNSAYYPCIAFSGDCRYDVVYVA